MNNEQTDPTRTTSQTEAYVENRAMKQHELEMLDLIASHFNDRAFTALDIGCADGLFCEALKQRLPDAQILGIDISEELICRANSRSVPDCEFTMSNIEKYEPNKKFNVIIASGILSAFQDYERLLENWLEWLEKEGVMFIFGRFNSKNIDTQVKFRNNYNQSDWEGGYSAYSVNTVSSFLKNKNLDHQFLRFSLKMDLPKSENPVITYTVNTEEGEKLIINGANLLAEFYFLKIINSP
jgi:trans-aconitate methyltransferase